MLVVGVVCIVLGLWMGRRTLQREDAQREVPARGSNATAQGPRQAGSLAASSPSTQAAGLSDESVVLDAALAALAKSDYKVAGGVPICRITGVVWASSPDPFEQVIAKLEQAPSPEEALQTLVERPVVGPVSGAVVTVRNDSGTWTTTTDSRGRFELPFLLEGTYEIVAEAAKSGTASSAMAVRRMKVGRSRTMSLQVRQDTIAVRGRICDEADRPVAGARILGEKAAFPDQRSEISSVPKEAVSAVSDSNGSFELPGFVPPDVRSAVAYLGRSGLAGEGVGTTARLTVTAEGYDDGEIVVPLITEELIDRTRRFSRAIGRFQKDPDADQPPEEVNSRLPSSQGNTIVGVNVVLHKAGN